MGRWTPTALYGLISTFFYLITSSSAWYSTIVSVSYVAEIQTKGRGENWLFARTYCCMYCNVLKNLISTSNRVSFIGLKMSWISTDWHDYLKSGILPGRLRYFCQWLSINTCKYLSWFQLG